MLYDKEKGKARKKLGRFFDSIADRFSMDTMDLIWAVDKNDTEKVRRAMQAGLDPNRTDGIERRPLPRAIDNLNVEMIALLLKGGADPNLPDMDGESALYKAVTWGEEAIVKMLLKAGGNPNIPTSKGITPLQAAQQRGNQSMIQLLLNPEKTIPKTTTKQAPKPRKTYTSAATQQAKESAAKNIEIAKQAETAAKKLREAAKKAQQVAKETAKEVMGEEITAKEIAEKQKPIVEVISQKEEATRIATPEKEAPKKKAKEAIPYVKETGSITGALIMAIEEDNEAAIAALLHQIKLEDLNKIDEKTGITPLYVAIQEKNAKATGIMIDKGADTLSVLPKKQHSPLSLAVSMDSLNLVKFIIKKSEPEALVQALNNQEQLLSPQYLAYNNPKMLDELLSGGADPNFGGKEGTSPLLKGIEKGSIGLLPLYVKNKLDLNQIVEGQSLLEWAIQYNRADWVNGLITEGANTQLKNKNGQTPLEYAASFGKGREAIVEILT